MTNNNTGLSGLFYHGTNIEVCLGDKVRIKRLFWRIEEGYVCYIPGISLTHDEMEFEGVKHWAIKASNGNVYPILYHPESFQPPKNIFFVDRSKEPGISPDYLLE